MKIYRIDKTTLKIEANNCIVIVKECLNDIKNRPVTSIQVIPDRYIGERKVVRRGPANVRVITLKKKLTHESL